MNVELTDERSGTRVSLAFAQLPQQCLICTGNMLGRPIAAVVDGKGWTCLDHLDSRLARLPAAKEFPIELLQRSQETYQVLRLGKGKAAFRTALASSLKLAEADGFTFLYLHDFQNLGVAVVAYTKADT